MNEYQSTNQFRWLREEVLTPIKGCHYTFTKDFKMTLQQKFSKGGELFKLSDTEYGIKEPYEEIWQDVTIVDKEDVD